MKLAVAINAKNEGQVIRRCIESAKQITDTIVLCDTGSTDSTVERATIACADFDLELHLARILWQDYATNQSALLRLAHAHCDFALVLDADEVVAPGSAPLLLDPAVDAYRVCRLLQGDYELWSPRIFSSAVAWRYEGKRHAYPTVATGPLGSPRIERSPLEILNLRDGASTGQDQRERFLRDAAHFRALCATNPDDARSAYYLAQSLLDAGELVAATEAFEHRISMGGGNQEEAFMAALHVARIAIVLRRLPSAVERTFERAHALRPERAEPAIYLAQWHNARGDYQRAANWAQRALLARNSDGFLVRRSHHTWLPLYELAQAYLGLGKSYDAASVLRDMLDCYPTLIPAPERVFAEQVIHLEQTQQSAC
jgi:tetratricopeptide (TPR) repeat protein